MSNQKLKVDAQPKTLHVKKLINRALRLFKKYKVIFAPLCVIITCIWGLSCDLYYYGYASYLGTDTLYIQKDSRSLLIYTVIFALSFVCSVFFAYNVSKQMDKNETSKGTALKSVAKSFGLCFLIFIIIVLLSVATGFRIVPEVILLPVFLFTFAFCKFIIFIIQFFAVLWKDLMKKINKHFANSKANAHPPTSQKAKAKNNHHFSKTKCFLTVLIIAILPMVSFFYAGRFGVFQNKEFTFVVSKFDAMAISNNKIQYNLVLSENDEYYCLSAYIITDINEVNKIYIYSNYQTIINKSEVEELKIVKMTFDQSEITKDELPL